VGEHVGVVAARFFEGVGKDPEANGVKLPRRQGTLLIDSQGEAAHGRREPGGFDGDRAEGIAENVPQQVYLRMDVWIG
jgi:hypothetical protein